MDILSQVLSTVRLEGAFYFKVTANEPWVSTNPAMCDIGAVVMPQSQYVIPFHIMMEGEAWAWPVDQSVPPSPLKAGEFIVLPNGCAHVIASEPKPEFIPPEDHTPYHTAAGSDAPFSLVELGGAGRKASFVCGYLGCDAAPFNPLLNALPDFMIIRPAGQQWEMLNGLILAALDEKNTAASGSETILSKLSELMFIQVLREYIRSLPEGSHGWLSGLRDERIGRALKIIHDRPEADWTLAALAQEAGMSRTSFSDHFSAFTGDTPLRYLARWRMQLASRLLESSRFSIAEVAEKVGYRSEAAFQRTFKKLVGETPGKWRRMHVRPAD